MLILQADIIAAAPGREEFLKADMVKEGALVIDVGITHVEDSTSKTGQRLKGDMDFENVSKKTSAITPLPGGVGHQQLFPQRLPEHDFSCLKLHYQSCMKIHGK